MPDQRKWLQAEQSGNDPLAEMLFARLVAELPPFEPSADFVGRAVHAAMRARARRRLARIAATLVLVTGTLGLMYQLSAFALALIVRGAVALSQGLVWLLTSTGEGAAWWSVAARIGATLGDAIAAPATAAAIAAAAMIALLSIYALQYLVREELGPRESRKA